MIRNRWVALICAAAAATVLSSCKAKPKTAVQARETAAAPTTVVSPPAASENASVASDNVLSGDLAELNRRGYLKDALFDYDKAELRPDARQALATDATWLKKYSSTRLLIEGHCDERGTDEYNLALGDRRAAAVREYLAAMGVGSTRVQTVSYGKERPFCNQETESCWQENRRGHMVITAK